jgi:hypothetical protein
MGRVLALVAVFTWSFGAFAAGDVPEAKTETDTQIQPKKVWSHNFKLDTSQTVIFKASVKTAQPVNFYVMKPAELRAYLAVVGSLNNHNFNHFKELYRESARDFNGSGTLEKGWYAFVIENPGPKMADVHVVVDTAPASPGGKLLRLPKTIAGPQGPGEGPGRYELAITRYTVSEKKNNGSDWDSGANPPDVEFMIASGQGTGVANVTRIKGGKHQNKAFGAGPEEDRWAFDWDGKGPVYLVAWDRDAMADDLIGAGILQTRKQPAREWMVLAMPFQKTTAQGKVAVTLAWRRLGDLAKGFAK